MRPINRGQDPTLGEHAVVFRCYQDARPHLIGRLGEYCSYCEMHLDAALATEHVRPKSVDVESELEWGNLLLGCVNCNSTKGSRQVVVEDYYWPDRHNTARAIEQVAGGYIRPRASLSGEQRARAESTIRLTGLDKVPDEKWGSDRRWINRYEAWDQAETFRRFLADSDTAALREAIKALAVAKGFFSVWMTVFRDDADMCERFIEAFNGTDSKCFDQNTFQPIDDIDRPWI